MYNVYRKREGKPERKPTEERDTMTEEMIARVKEMIKAGKPLHGWALDIAIEIELREMEAINREEETAKLIDGLAG